MIAKQNVKWILFKVMVKCQPGFETSLWTISYFKHPSQQKICYFKIKLKINKFVEKGKDILSYLIIYFRFSVWTLQG